MIFKLLILINLVKAKIETNPLNIQIKEREGKGKFPPPFCSSLLF